MIQIPKLDKWKIEFPKPSSANEDGIVAWGGDLTPSRLIRAYQEGIFPWFSKDDPILWWSPNPRFILDFEDFKLRKSLKKSLKKFTYKFDTNFSQVINECASIPREGQNGTWIVPEMTEAYKTLFDMGYVHCVESYFDGELIGGLYGVTVGGVFCGESMFSKKSDASKSAFYVLVKHLQHWGYSFIDAQVYTPHLESLGAKEIKREEFLKRLHQVRFNNISHKWQIDNELINKII